MSDHEIELRDLRRWKEVASILLERMDVLVPASGAMTDSLEMIERILAAFEDSPDHESTDTLAFESTSYTMLSESQFVIHGHLSDGTIKSRTMDLGWRDLENVKDDQWRRDALNDPTANLEQYMGTGDAS